MIIRYSTSNPDKLLIFWDGSVEAWAAICKLKYERCELKPDRPDIVIVGDAIFTLDRGSWVGVDSNRTVRYYPDKFVYGLVELHGAVASDYFHNIYLNDDSHIGEEAVSKASILEAVGEHFNRHKKVYLAIGITAAVCGTVGYLAYKMKPVVVQTINGDIHAPVSAMGDAIQNINFGLERRVHPGWITQCVETGEKFASQNRAAEVFGASSKAMSRHLNGLRESVNGYHFVRIQEFVTT